MKTLLFCIFLFFTSVVLAQVPHPYGNGGNCNSGLVNGLYYCHQNGKVPFSLSVGAANPYHGHENDFSIEARAFGCASPLYGEYEILGESLTFKFAQGCHNFNGIYEELTFNTVFNSTCVSFEGATTTLEHGDRVVDCILSQYDPAYYIDYYAFITFGSSSTIAVGLFTTVVVIFAILF